jgi:hypothetical protein
MARIDPESTPSNGTLPDPEGTSPESEPTSWKPPSEGLGRLLALAIVAALMAGAASWLVGERIMDAYRADLLPNIEAHPSAESVRRWRDARLYSATLTYATMGGFLGLAMGLAGGLLRRSALAAARAAIAGFVLGTIAVASASVPLVSYFYQARDPQSTDLVLPLFTHGAIWSAAGAIGGLALGLGLGGAGRWKATMVGAIVGAAAATIVYEIVGALAFATAKTDLPLSASLTTRGMAQLLVATLAAIGAVLALHQTATREARSSLVS